MILAGGASRRFGTDKAFADWNGRPYLRCVADAALTICKDLLILGRSDVPISKYHDVVPEARVRVDVKYQAGPVVALREGQVLMKAEWILVLPCDAPALSPDDVQVLLEAARSEKGPAVAVAGKDVLYDLFCLPRASLEERLQDAKRLEDLVANARQVPIPERVGLNLNERPGARSQASP